MLSMFYNKAVKKYSKDGHNFEIQYKFWFDYLLERVSRLFEWDGLPFPQKELELRLLVNGFCGLVPYKNTYVAIECSPSGVTQYYDEFTTITYACPLFSGSHMIDDMYILANNDTLRTSVIPIIHHYAVELAHCDVTMVDSLVLNRAGSTITAPSGTASESAVAYINSLFEGKIRPINDDLFNNIKFNSFASNESFVNAHELERNLLGEFFESFGIATAYKKKGNMTEDEVSRNDNLLLINANDMLKAREEIANKLTKAMAREVTVKPLIDLGATAEEVENGDNDN